MTIKFDQKNYLKILAHVICLMFFFYKPAFAQTQSNLQDVQQIVAIVNDEVISLFDLKQRALMLIATSGQRQVTPEQQRFIQSQAMDALIDDKLKIQEASEYNATAGQGELDQAFNNYARQLNLDPDELEKQLNETGIEKQTLITQIAASMAWSGVVQGLLQPLVNVTDDEVQNLIDKMERDKGKLQYKISEIFILVTDNARRAETLETAKLISDQLNQDVSFEAVARQFSQSSTAAVGGDLGWVMTDELPAELKEAILNMEIGQVSEPIETEDGIYIVKLNDTSRILELNKNDIAVNLRFIFFDQNEDNSQTLEELNNQFYSSLSQTDTCERYEEKAAEFGASDYGDVGSIKLGAVPRQLHEEMLSMEIGAGTKLFEDDGGYRSLILCAKEIPEVTLPDFETVLENLTQTRLQLVARRHLRDLRRDAIIDYR